MARRYTIGRPLQEVRLRNWPAGRVAQLKTAIQRLEAELNTSVASQINQPGKRQFNTRVPKITDLSVNAGFRSFQISFSEPQGINDLLFYEIEHADNASFANATTVQTNKTTTVISNINPGETRFFRASVVNSRFQTGPLSDSATATSPSLRIESDRLGTRATVTIDSADVDTWTDIATNTNTSSGGQVAVIAHVGARPYARGATPNAQLDATSEVTVEFRILRDGATISGAGIARAVVTSEQIDVGGGGPVDPNSNEAAHFATLVTPFANPGSGTFEYKLQARIIDAESGISTNNGGSSASYDVDTDIIADLLDIVEVAEV